MNNIRTDYSLVSWNMLVKDKAFTTGKAIRFSMYVTELTLFEEEPFTSH